MRRQILNFIVPAIIVTLTLSLTIVVPAIGDQNPVVTKLERLHDMIADEHPSLGNKVNAVIHQVEAGAINGAINKLENDLIKSIEAWVDDPEEALALVSDILDDLRGIRRPDFEIDAEPDTLTIEQGQSKKSLIRVTSKNGFNESVDLEVTSAPEGVTPELEPTTVTPPANGTETSELNATVTLAAEPGNHKIKVNGKSGTIEHSVTIDLTITEAPKPEEDRTPPTIASVLRNPKTPPYNESVTVTAFVYDEGGSGVKQVILNYSSGSVWTPVNMILQPDGLYTAGIPVFPYDTSVEYRVFASDNNGNVATPSSLYSYKVTDPYPPLLTIDSPAQGSYLAGKVTITAFMKDQNSGGESGFGGAELSINGTVVKTWEPPAPTQPTTYIWNTTAFGPDGVYMVKLKVLDKAGNAVEKSLKATVDNTLPSAVISEPAHGSYVRLSKLIKVTGGDANFDKMEVRIDEELVRTSITKGSEVLEWNTRNYDDGAHSITLKVYDKAGNVKEALVNVTADNTPPSIGTPSWSPKEPPANVDIKINVTVTEPTYGSGVQNVILWFKNKTIDDWQFMTMVFQGGNWTATLSNQSDTDVKFFIEAFDRAGNMAEKEQLEFTVAAPAGFPLAWILAAIAAIGAGSGGGAYYMRRRRKKGMIASSVPAAALAEPVPPPSLAPAPTRKPIRRRAQSGGSVRSVHSR